MNPYEDDIVALQHFLMDATRREPADLDEQTRSDALAVAASLDYALMLATGTAKPAVAPQDAAREIDTVLREAIRMSVRILAHSDASLSGAVGRDSLRRIAALCTRRALRDDATAFTLITLRDRLAR